MNYTLHPPSDSSLTKSIYIVSVTEVGRVFLELKALDAGIINVRNYVNVFIITYGTESLVMCKLAHPSIIQVKIICTQQ